MRVVSRILRYFRKKDACSAPNDWGSKWPDDHESPDTGRASSAAESILFYLDCPCGCGRSVRMVLSPARPGKQYDIPKIGNKFWRQLVDENGLEAAIEYLHENA